MQQDWIKLHPKDNLVVALRPLRAGEVFMIEGQEITLATAVGQKHKFTTTAIEIGAPLFMYGVLVAQATEKIPQGSLIHTSNVVHASASYHEAQSEQSAWQPPDVNLFKNREFLGYHRADGRVGTANYWLVIPLVFCENRNVEVIKTSLVQRLGYGSKQQFSIPTEQLIEAYKAGKTIAEIEAIPLRRSAEERSGERIFPHVDGIKFLTHEGGCGGTREDAETLCRLLAGYINHPNVAGATVLSLGCQNAQVTDLQAAIHHLDQHFQKPVYFLEQQASKNEEAFLAEAVRKTFIGLMEANKNCRQPAPLSKLSLGLECGGSDGFSGISANPTLGYTADLLVALGGQTVLAEFPELNGVEQELVNRCTSPALAAKFTQLMQNYNQRAEAVGSGFKNNPSPGNIRDGLITDAIKSAGAAKKGGTSPIVDVLDYTEPIKKAGLSLLCTPGNDVESTTGLAGSGCNLIVFTTGLGTPTGNPIVPVVKLSSNNALAARMPDIIDFNSGDIITGQADISSKGTELLEYLIQVASGQQITAAQRLEQDDFIPWKRGVSL